MKPAFGPQTLLVLALLALAGCAQDNAEINTVQPNYSKKSDLLGREWYVRSTVVGANFTNATSFPGDMGQMERGVFEVQEKALYFYRTYEFMQGSEAYAQKSDVDKPMLDKDGKPIFHAVPQNYQKVQCTADAECSAGARCADAKRQGKWLDEEDYTGFCVSRATKYIYRGAPVMAFPIDSHFDIRHDFSTTSGEKTNKIIENSTDRKWYDREFIRVRWGVMQLQDYGFNLLRNVAAVVHEGDTAPEGEQFETGVETKDGVLPQHYMSFVDRQIVTAPTTYLEGYGNIPICFFYPWSAGGVFDCASEEYKVRFFFLEVPRFVDPQSAYVAREQDDVEMSKFGYFRTERATYDIQFGNTFHNAVRRTQRHRIWDKYVKALDANGAWKGDFDYAKMNPVPIVYYLNDDHPRELVPAAAEIASSWSGAFEEVVSFHKGAKTAQTMFVLCENSDASAKLALDAGLTYEKHDVAEHGAIGNYPATPNAKFCRHMDEPHRFGDLRYSFMHAIPAPSQNSLYGYGPSAADPISGEIIAASAHSYVAAMKQGAESALQALELQSGVLDFNDVERASQKVYNINAKRAKTYDQKGPKSLAAIRDAVGGMMDPDVRQRLGSEGLEREENAGSYAQARMARLQQNPQLDAMLAADDDGHSIQALFRDPTAKKGAESPVSPDKLQTISLATWAHTAGMQKRQKVFDQLAEKTLHFADFSDGALVGLALEYGRQYDRALCLAYAASPGPLFKFPSESGPDADNGACTAGQYQSTGPAQGRVCATVGGPAPHWSSCSAKSLMQTIRLALNSANGRDPNAELLNALPGPLYWDTMDPDIRAAQEIGRTVVAKMRKEIKLGLWQRIYQDTQMHEVGHTLGLRHNFEASTDSLNFHREFWDLKLDAAGDVINPLQSDTPEQGAGHIREQQLASVMDYTAKFNGRFAGIGLYDKAAIRFGYGDMVEAFNHPPTLDKEVPAPKSVAAMGQTNLPPAKDYLATPGDSDPSIVQVLEQGQQDMLKLTRRLHYSSWPKYFGTDKKSAIDNIYDRSFVSWRDIKGDRCTVDTECGADRKCLPLGENSYCSKQNLAAGKPLVEVPYRFCSDEYNGATPSCSTNDEGVDAYDIAKNALDDYEQYWYFWGFARDSEVFYPDNYYNRVARQFQVAVRQFQYWTIDFATHQQGGWWKARYGQDYDKDINGGLAGAYSAMNTFNVLAQVLARPTPGYYFYNPKKDWLEHYNAVDQANNDPHFLDEPEGARPLYPAWGGGYMYRPMTGGQFYDRLAAFALLADPTTGRYNGVNKNEDMRRYLVNFFRVFPRQLINLFAGEQIDDAHMFGWYMLQGPPNDADYLMRRVWVGPDAGKLPVKCTDVATLPPEQQTGCLKYAVYPDDRPMFPSSRFRMPLLGAVYGMSLLTKGFDRTYMDLSRVFMQGNHHQIDLPASVKPEDIAKFTDPLSGKTYVAARLADDVLNPAFIAVQQAQKELDKFPDLQTLQDTYLFSDYQYRVSLLELVRSLHETYEY